MTNDEREALIECLDCGRTDGGCDRIMHTPTDDEREALEDQLRKEFEYRIRTAVAYGAMKNYREIPSQVRADWIQGEISKAMSVARTRVLDGFRRPVQVEPRVEYLDVGHPSGERQPAYVEQTAAGFRRPVQAEPTDAQACERCGCVDGEHLDGCSALVEPTEVDADPDTAFELGRVAGYDEAMREVQAEPTDAQVQAFVTVINAVGVVLDRRTVKAGLRAAFQEGENR